MSSFELIYEEEEDVLEVTFEVIDENFSRSIALNENIVIHTDSGLTSIWGITFYSYKTLLQVSETHLDGLRELPFESVHNLLGLLARSHASPFISMLDSENLRALVKSPKLEELLAL